MVKREFRVKMVDDFKQNWLKANVKHEGLTMEQTRKCYDGMDLDALHDKISGQEVVMVEEMYVGNENDFFEKEDDDFMMYPELWTEI